MLAVSPATLTRLTPNIVTDLSDGGIRQYPFNIHLKTGDDGRNEHGDHCENESEDRRRQAIK